jgi:hypothetical protein
VPGTVWLASAFAARWPDPVPGTDPLDRSVITRTYGAVAGVPPLTLLRLLRRTEVCRMVATNVIGGNLGERCGERARCAFASSGQRQSPTEE